MVFRLTTIPLVGFLLCILTTFATVGAVDIDDRTAVQVALNNTLAAVKEVQAEVYKLGKKGQPCVKNFLSAIDLLDKVRILLSKNNPQDASELASVVESVVVECEFEFLTLDPPPGSDFSNFPKELDKPIVKALDEIMKLVQAIRSLFKRALPPTPVG